MNKKDNLETKVFQDEKKYQHKIHCKLIKQQKNGISPWKNTEKRKKRLQKNESGQQSFEEKNERAPPFSCREISKPQPLSTEDGAKHFNTELNLFNDLVVTSELMSCNEYVPYYRTHANLVEPPVCINTEVKQEDTEREDRIQSNGCIFKPKYEDEPLNDMSFATGYFPYYRTCEEYLGNWDLPRDVYGRVESEENETDSVDEIESDNDCESEEEYEDRETYETNEDASQCLESLEVFETHGSTDSILKPCTSEISLYDDVLSLDQLPSSSGYFPYYRTYGKLLLSPVDSNHVFCSHEDALGGFGVERGWIGEGSRDYSKGCTVC